APASTYTLSLYDALPISDRWARLGQELAARCGNHLRCGGPESSHESGNQRGVHTSDEEEGDRARREEWSVVLRVGHGLLSRCRADRKSTRLNSSHVESSY